MSVSSSLSFWSLWIPRVAVVEAAGNLQPHRWFVLETDLGILGTQVGGKAKRTGETIQGVCGERRVLETVPGGQPAIEKVPGDRKEAARRRGEYRKM